ncbi:MAG: LamG domain-containing protein, partial [Nitrososphaeraceae archaeon]
MKNYFIFIVLAFIFCTSLFSESAFAIDAKIISDQQTLATVDQIAPVSNNVQEQLEIIPLETNSIPILDILNIPTSNNPAVLLFLIPVLSFVIVRTAESDLRSYYFRKFSCFAMIVILVGWTFSVPGAMANGYWGMAYAEESPTITPPILSFDFDISNTKGIIYQGDAKEIFDATNPYLSLNGATDYLRVKESSTNDLNQLTVSAWIKPDYSSGSPVFTVLGKDGSFVLDVNNILSPEKIAVFYVFDGIKWHQVQSESTIPEEWTHIAATISDTGLSLYVNGKLESTLSDFEPSSDFFASSKSSLTVGAFSAEKRSEASIKNKFSGSIDAIKVYDTALNPAEIQQIFDNNKESTTPKPIAKESIDAVKKIVKTIAEIPNQFGFVSDGQEHHAQLQDEKFSLGFTIKKPEDKKHKPIVDTSLTSTTTGVNDTQPPEEAQTEPEVTTTGGDDTQIPEEAQTEPEVTITGGDDTSMEITEPVVDIVQQENGMFKKMVIVEEGTETTSTEIPEELVESGAEITLSGIVDGVKEDITDEPSVNLEFVDTDDNGVADTMTWNVPDDVTKFYIQSDITIINVQSYPTVGDNWEVLFTTIGTDKLVITPIKGTTFGNSLPDDLKFLELRCGDQVMPHQMVDGSIVVDNYFCEETSIESSHVFTPGEHYIEFKFGDDVGYAQNLASPDEVFIPGVIRDFKIAHPDFEPAYGSLIADLGIVKSMIDNPGSVVLDDHNPIYDSPPTPAGTLGSTSNTSNFDEWYTTDTTVPIVNEAVSCSLKLVKITTDPDPPLYEFSDSSFYPIDDDQDNVADVPAELFNCGTTTFGDETVVRPNGNTFSGHNWHFSSEFHSTFTYRA